MLISKTRILTVGLTGLLAVGIIGGTTAAFAAPRDNAPAGAEARHGGHFGLRVTVKAIAEACDLSREDLKAGYQAGQSINDMVIAEGGDPEACKAEVLAKLEARLTAAVESGKITEEQKANILAKADEAVTRIMAWVPSGDGARPTDAPIS